MWFEVDKKGLAKLLERKGRAFAVYELLQNAWDEDSTRVDVTLQRIPGTRRVELVVEDDSPAGFKNLDHAFTLFAESSKKSQADRRGRFNLGEKLTLALMSQAEIASTSGTIVFDESGRTKKRSRREAGSRFRGVMQMTDGEMAEVGAAVMRLLPPAHITTTYNGTPLAVRTPIAKFTASLATEIGDEEGILRRVQRQIEVHIHEPLEAETPALYEMGVPVVDTGDRWHLDVQGKVPLNFDRDNVPPAYLSRVRALAVEHMAQHLQPEDANAAWVREAIQKHHGDLSEQTIQRVATLRFGDKRVAYDPSDPEANALAVTQGYQVVHGSQLSKSEWEAMRRTGAILPAGRVTPSPRPYSDDPDAPAQRLVPREKWTPQMVDTLDLVGRVSECLLGTRVAVEVASDITWPFAAAYGSGRMVFNLGRLGHKWFDRAAGGQLEKILALTVHELAHHYSGNHLSEEYHDALTSLGARLAVLALRDPALFA